MVCPREQNHVGLDSHFRGDISPPSSAVIVVGLRDDCGLSAQGGQGHIPHCDLDQNTPPPHTKKDPLQRPIVLRPYTVSKVWTGTILHL